MKKRSYRAWAIGSLGLVIGILWFSYGLRLPPANRGLLCCDALEYLRYGSNGFMAALGIASHRTFGYPLFIAAITIFTGTGSAQVAGVTIIQLLCSFSSSAFLAWSFWRCGFKFRPWMLAVLFSNPALSCIASVPLTDSLATSLFTAVISLCLLMSFELRWRQKCVLATGAAFGALTALRPVFILLVPVFFTLVAVIHLREGISIRTAKKVASAILLCSLCFIPFFMNQVRNCYGSFGQFCFVDPEFSGRSFALSFNYAFSSSRLDGVVKPNVTPEMIPTPDLVLANSCHASVQHPVESLLKCYGMNRRSLPMYFIHRLFGLFDVRHITPYAASVTPVWVAWTNRVFSALALSGLFIILILMVDQIVRRRPWEYLLLPLAYIAIQINFHVENRYIFPLIPICTSLALLTLCNPRACGRWVFSLACLVTLTVIAAYLSLISAWDVGHFARHGFL